MANFPQPERFVEERDKDKSKVFTVRLNQGEQDMCIELMKMFNMKSPISALKAAAIVGRNVLHNTFSADFLRYMFSKERVRLEDYDARYHKIMRKSNTKSDVFVTQDNE